MTGYFLFDSEATTFFGQGKYPKRRRKFEPQKEDHAIYFGGSQIGWAQSTVPWLNTNTWGGLGIMQGQLANNRKGSSMAQGLYNND